MALPKIPLIGLIAIIYGILFGLLAVGLVVVAAVLAPTREVTVDSVKSKRLTVTENSQYGVVDQVLVPERTSGYASLRTGPEGRRLVAQDTNPVFFVDSDVGSKSNSGRTAGNPLPSVTDVIQALADLPFWRGQAHVHILNQNYSESRSTVEWSSPEPLEETGQSIQIIGPAVPSSFGLAVDGAEIQAVNFIGRGWAELIMNKSVPPDDFAFMSFDGELYPVTEPPTTDTVLLVAAENLSSTVLNKHVDLVMPGTEVNISDNLIINNTGENVPIHVSNLTFKPTLPGSKLSVLGAGTFDANTCYFKDEDGGAGNLLAMRFDANLMIFDKCRFGSGTNLGTSPPIIFSGEFNKTAEMVATPGVKVHFGDKTQGLKGGTVLLRDSVFAEGDVGSVEMHEALTTVKMEHVRFLSNHPDHCVFIQDGATGLFDDCTFSNLNPGEPAMVHAVNSSFAKLNAPKTLDAMRAGFWAERSSKIFVNDLTGFIQLWIANMVAGSEVSCVKSTTINFCIAGGIPISTTAQAWGPAVQTLTYGASLVGPIPNFSSEHCVLTYSYNPP